MVPLDIRTTFGSVALAYPQQFDTIYAIGSCGEFDSTAFVILDRARYQPHRSQTSVIGHCLHEHHISVINQVVRPTLAQVCVPSTHYSANRRRTSGATLPMSRSINPSFGNGSDASN